MKQWKERLRAAGVHFGISMLIAGLAALLVFALWYPYPYREISGGRELFLLVVAVDVVLGPLLTFAVFNRAKPWTELRRDLAVVCLLQLAGLGYGVWTVAAARPVHLVFEIDRFRVIHAIEVADELLDRAPPNLQKLPWSGPGLLSLRPFKDEKEKVEATLSALGGVSLSSRPDLWQPYEAGKNEILQIAKPVAQLRIQMPAKAVEIDGVLNATGRKPDTLLYVPLAGRKSFWTVFIDPQTAQPLAFMPLDPF
jgi:hypothetical protein